MSSAGVTGLIGVLAFVIAMLVSVMIHEWGHFITARKYGMKVTEFFLGFGPRIWSTKRGETEFGVKAIPAGGYCRITGMTPIEPIADEDSGRAFFKASVPRRLVVLGAGRNGEVGIIGRLGEQLPVGRAGGIIETKLGFIGLGLAGGGVVHLHRELRGAAEEFAGAVGKPRLVQAGNVAGVKSRQAGQVAGKHGEDLLHL